MTWLERSRLVARTELRRRWRRLKDDTTQLIALAFVLVMVLPFSVAGLFGAYVAGGLVAGSGTGPVVEWARVAFGYTWIAVVAFGGYRAYAVGLGPDNIDGLLTTVSHRDVVGGLVGAELALWFAVVLTFGSTATVAFAVGAGSVLAAPLVGLTLCLVLVTALPAGFVLVLGVRNAGVRSVLLGRLRTPFLVLLGIGYVALIVTNAFASVLEPLYRLLAPTPIGWFGDLAVIPLGVGASPLRAIGAVGFSAAFVVVLVAALFRLSAWLWYADGVQVTHEMDRSTDGSSRVGVLSRVLSRPVLGVVATDWKRARRSPISLSFALYPLIVLAGPLATAVRTGEVGTGLPLWLLLCGTWITGSLFALNVLGNEGAALPATLLSADPGRALVVGHTVSGVSLATPATVAVTVVTGLLSPHSLPIVASLGLAALILPTLAGAIATGIGTAFPRFEAVTVSRSRKAIVPSFLAFAVYSVAILGASLPAAVAHSGITGHALASVLGVSRFLVGIAGTIISAGIASGVGAISVHVARRRIADFRLE